MEAFKKLKTSFSRQEGQQDKLPGGSKLDTTPAVPVLGQEPGEISENTAKQNVVAHQHNHIESMAIEDENALGYETDEDEFDPGSRSSRPSNMHLVTLGQSNWSPGDTLLISTECPQVQDEHPWMKTTREEEEVRTWRG